MFEILPVSMPVSISGTSMSIKQNKIKLDMKWNISMSHLKPRHTPLNHLMQLASFNFLLRLSEYSVWRNYTRVNTKQQL